MEIQRRTLAQACLLLLLGGGSLRAESAAVDFNDDIRPILSDRCFVCHGFDANAREADLRLDTPEGALEPRSEEDGPAIIPGDPDASPVWQRITARAPDEVMPPPDFLRQLSKKDKELIKRWIEQGAEYEPHWTFVPVQKPILDSNTGHPVDQLVTRRLAREKLSLAPAADKHTLARRLSFDLRGLPPTAAELETFLHDSSPGAWENLVDRYLADPAFGERMAWPWLEAARYADSNGFQGDLERTMWPWRDWVIEAFNKNLPYDDFTVWQIAGDLLPNPTFEQKLATGFLRNHAINGEGGSIPEENRVNYVMDMAETVGTVWMGLTFNCCRCHDHKYDPLTQKEYYGLTDFFNQTPVTGGGKDPQTPPNLAAPTAEQVKREKELLAAIPDLEKRLTELTAQLTNSGKQAAWEETLRSSSPTAEWELLPMTDFYSRSTSFDLLEDQSSLLKVQGYLANANYEVTVDPTPGPVAAIRLEAMRHPTMTKGRLAPSNSGNFVLTDFSIQVIGKDGKKRTLPIDSAEATYEQNGFPVKNAIDRNGQSGWAVWNGKDIPRNHAAVFRFKKPVNLTPGERLLFTLKHQSKHQKHLIGRFRLSLSRTSPPLLKDEDQALITALQTPPGERTDDQKALLRHEFLRTFPGHRELDETLSNHRLELERLRKAFPRVMIMADRKQRRKTHVLAIGSYEQPGEAVTAHTPAFLPPLDLDKPGNRLDLARWLVDRNHPLTARVTVNRLWQEFFGIGLVKTPEDFGVQSEIPVHPELLDWLAADFMDHGWDYKRLVRTIVTSRTYRQSSTLTPALLERDPSNRLLARGPRFRLPSWMIRDQALAVSKRLVATQGGEPVRPWQPEGLWSEVTFGNKKYQPDTGEGLRRRSLYTFWRRISAPPMFFDTAKREMCEVGTTRTNSPLHALSILNDPLYAENSRALAARAVRETSAEPAAALSRAFFLIQGRPPARHELEILLSSYNTAKTLFAEHPEDAEKFLSIGDSPRHPDLDPVPHAALASICLSLLNTDEALTKE